MANKNKIINQAQKYIGKGQWDKAIKELNKLIAEDPSDVRTLLKLGDVYSKKGDRAQATATYKQVAESYSGQGFFLKAVAVYKQILKHDPNQLAVVLKLAELYEHLGLAQEAMAQYQRASQIHDEQGDTRSSLDVLRRMVDLDQDNVASRIKLAEGYSREGSIEDAVREFERAAKILSGQNRIEDYIKVAERLVYHAPERTDVIKQLARHYMQAGETKRGLAKLQLCFKTDPRDVETLELLADAFKALGQSQKTVFVYRELASVYKEQQDGVAEERAYRAILEIDPHDAEARAGLGMAQTASSAPMGEVLPPEALSPPEAISASIDLELLPPEEEDGGFAPEGNEAVTEMPREADDFDPLAVDFGPVGGSAFTDDAPPPRAPSHAPPVRMPSHAPPPRAPSHAPPPHSPPPAGAPAGELAKPPASSANEQVARLLTETDVFIKYGLGDKALEHLRAVFALDPDYIPAYEKMRDIYLGQGDSGRAGEAMAHILHVHARQGDNAALEAARAQLASIAPGHPLAAGGLPGAIPAPPPMTLEESEEISIDIDEDSFEMLGDEDIGEVRALAEDSASLGRVLTDSYDEAYPSFGSGEEMTVAADEDESLEGVTNEIDEVAIQAAEMAANMGWDQSGQSSDSLLLEDEGLIIAEPSASVSVDIAPPGSGSASLPSIDLSPSLSADLVAPAEAGSLSLDIEAPISADMDAPAPIPPSISGADLALDLDEPVLGSQSAPDQAATPDLLPPDLTPSIDLAAPAAIPAGPMEDSASIKALAEAADAFADFEADSAPAEVEEVTVDEPTAEDPSVDIDDDLEEIDFFLQAGLTDEAKEALETLQERAPNDARIAERFAQLVDEAEEEAPVEDAEAAVAAPLDPPSTVEQAVPYDFDQTEAADDSGLPDEALFAVPDLGADSSDALDELEQLMQRDAEATPDAFDAALAAEEAQLDELVPLDEGGLEEVTPLSEEASLEDIAPLEEAPSAALVEDQTDEHLAPGDSAMEAAIRQNEANARDNDALLNGAPADAESIPQATEDFPEQTLSPSPQGVDLGAQIPQPTPEISPENAEDAYDQAMMFRELGMLDEAISNFETAAASPQRALTCREMIGLCHLEKGLPLEAVKHLEAALHLGADGRAATNLKYEVGAAYEAAGDDRQALHWFEACASDDDGFREVGSRIADVAQRLSDGGATAATGKKSKISYL